MKFSTYKSKLKLIIVAACACLTLCNLNAQDDINIQSNDGRIYVEAGSIYIGADAIFLHLDGVFIPMQCVGVDGNGVYAIPQVDAGPIKCSSCDRYFDPNNQSRICPHNKRKY